MLVSRCAALLIALGLLAPVHADPPPEGPEGARRAAPPEASPYGDSYTPEELAALDRALHAGNLTRTDLTFRKDMAKGKACFPIVREMLHDPMLIAPVMDLMARSSQRLSDATRWRARVAVQTATDAHDRYSLQEHISILHRSGGSLDKPTSIQEAMASLLRIVGEQPLEAPVPKGQTEDPSNAQILRARLPADMLMREVLSPPFGAEMEAAIRERAGAQPMEVLYGWVSPYGSSDADISRLLAWLDSAPTWDSSVFPQDAPMVEESLYGRIALGTPKDDVYTGDYAAIIDPGGNDRYEHGRFGAAFGTRGQHIGLLIDLGGNDVYDCGDVDVTLGAACFGTALLADLGQGNDRYVAGHLSLGAAVGGVGVLYDDGGSDTYQGKTFTQGAAGFGIGILYDDAVGEPPVVKTDDETKDPIDIAKWDNDRLSAWCCAQAFARTKGVALCINTRGNEIYEAGGVYLHAPLFADRYQSFSQGFAIGSREIDYAGGLAMLIDRAGNDRYLGDIYNQGVGYWYSAGLLWDGGGNDVYEMTQYGQGSGIHLAVGGLVDVSGSDAYLMHSGLGQGGSHDFAASVLHDRGGNDRYHGNTSCNGCGLTNSVGLFLDRSGDDTYAARRDGGLNAGRPARGFGSVGLFVDLSGKDDYLGPQKDEAQWRDSDVGLGIDVKTAPTAPGTAGSTSEPNQVTGKAEIPPVVSYEGPLTQEVFDELWGIAIRWEVGDNRVIVPEARKRLIAFGPEVIALLDGKMDDNDTGLALRAYVDVLKALSAAGAAPRVLDMLRSNAGSGSEPRRRTALMLIGELKVKEAAYAVVAVLEGKDESLSRRAAGVLQLLGSHAGDERLKTWLASDDERRVLAALGTLLGLDSDVYPAVRSLLAHPMVTVRTRLATLLAERQATYAKAVLADLSSTDLGDRALRTLLDAIVRGPITPDSPAVARTAALLTNADWAMRADAARVLRTWLAAKDADAALLAPGGEALTALLATETDPFVRSQASAR